MSEAEDRKFIAQFKAGMTVRVSYDRTRTGTIIPYIPEEYEGEDVMSVAWSDGEISVVDVLELRIVDTENDALVAEQIQAKIREAETAFETAFKAWQEVQDLASKDSDLYVLRSSGLIDLSKLEDIINTGGWSTSSMYC